MRNNQVPPSSPSDKGELYKDILKADSETWADICDGKGTGPLGGGITLVAVFGSLWSQLDFHSLWS